MQYALSLCLFALLVAMVPVRAAALRRRGVRAMAFGKTDRSDFLLMPLVLAFVYIMSARVFGLPVWGPLFNPFWAGGAPGWAGLALCAIAVAGFALTLAGFGDSFRVGIDDERPDRLITTGAFAVSRNPIYVCFLAFFAGQLLIHRNPAIAAVAALFAMAIHRQVIREEAFLARHYGAEYEAYRKRVRRYL